MSYHSRTPVLSEEVKVRLPDVLTARHWLLLTVIHVHVKQKTANKTFLDVISLKPDEVLDTSGTVVGAGFLAVMPEGKALVTDGEHSVPILDFGEGTDVMLTSFLLHPCSAPLYLSIYLALYPSR